MVKGIILYFLLWSLPMSFNYRDTNYRVITAAEIDSHIIFSYGSSKHKRWVFKDGADRRILYPIINRNAVAVLPRDLSIYELWLLLYYLYRNELRLFIRHQRKQIKIGEHEFGTISANDLFKNFNEMRFWFLRLDDPIRCSLECCMSSYCDVFNYDLSGMDAITSRIGRAESHVNLLYRIGLALDLYDSFVVHCFWIDVDGFMDHYIDHMWAFNNFGTADKLDVTACVEDYYTSICKYPKLKRIQGFINKCSLLAHGSKISSSGIILKSSYFKLHNVSFGRV